MTLLAPQAVQAQTFRVLHAFERPASLPQARLLQGSDGSLYGVSSSGPGEGTVFSVGRDGSGYRTLHTFDDSDGSAPQGSLVQGPDGTLFGVCSAGGLGGYGAVFSLRPDGSQFRVLHHFGSSDGVSPYVGLTLSSDGRLYGTTHWGGAPNKGVVFRLNVDGTGYSVVHEFEGSGGENPLGRLVEGPDGSFYGTTFGGGLGGTLFSLRGDGSNFTVLLQFGDATGGSRYPRGDLALDDDGVLYGAVSQTIFRVRTDGSGYSSLRQLSDADGMRTWDGLVLGSDGYLYGTNVDFGPSGGGTVFRLSRDGLEFDVLHGFAGLDGRMPFAGVTEGADGLLYGSAFAGGSFGHGSLYRIAPDGGGFASLFSPGGPSGDSPIAGLARGSDGQLYGTTTEGGLGYGTVFSVAPDGSWFQTLRVLDGEDGGAPLGVLSLVGEDLFGTTSNGGSAGSGAVFRLGTDGTNWSILHSFQGSDGKSPKGGLLVGADGNLYGTTAGGGQFGRGAVFRISPGGEFTLLHSLATSGDPNAGLVQGSDGTLYGTTRGYGDNGTVFRMLPDGSGFQTLHVFQAGEGRLPLAGVTLGPQGTLLGVTQIGGASDGGTLFRLRTDGSEFVTLHSFGGQAFGGLTPIGGLTLGADGWVYGTTSFGFSSHAPGLGQRGVLFRIRPDGTGFTGLSPFRPMSGTEPMGNLLFVQGTIYGVASIEGPGQGGTVFAWEPNTSADLALRVRPSAESVASGGSLSFEVEVTNSGAHDASGVLIHVRQEPGSQLRFVQKPPECGLVYGSTIVCGVPLLGVGASASWSFTVVADQPGIATTVFDVYSDTLDFVASNNEVSVHTAVATEFGVFHLASSTFVAQEPGVATVSVVRELGSSPATIRYKTVAGSATPGSDFVSTFGKLSFEAGETTRNVTVPILDGCRSEGTESFQIEIFDPSGGAILSGVRVATISIEDDDDPGTFQFESAAIAHEERGLASVKVTRTPRSPGLALACGVSVGYRTEGGSATAGRDFLATSGRLAFGAGQDARSFLIRVVPDSVIEADETVGLALVGPSNGAAVGGIGSATLTITSDDRAGEFQFKVATLVAREGTTATVVVQRQGGLGADATVAYATSDISATAPTDYLPATGVLKFPAGASRRTLTLRIRVDRLTEGDETLELVLSAPSAGGTLGVNDRLSVIIPANTR